MENFNKIEKSYDKKEILKIILISAVILTFITYLMRVNTEILTIIGLWLRNPFSFLLNVLPIIALMLIILAINGRLDLSLIITTIATLAIAYINIQKIYYREEPLVIADIFNVSEAINMIVGFGFGINSKLIVLLLLLLIASIGIYFFTRKYRIKKEKRIPLLVTTISIFIVALLTVYSSEFIYNSFPRTVENETNIAESYKDKGLIYCLLYHRDSHRIKKPINYNRDYLVEIKEDFQHKKPKIKPHVVMVMGEGWSDISNNLDFKKGKDPYKYANKAIKESLYSGHIITPTYGGGTSNTEYDSLTGASSLKHSEGIFSAYSAIRGPRKSIVRTFNDNGYNSIAIHPGKDWFYNRENVYEYLGFDKSYFEDDFINPQYKGGFISEKELTEYVIDIFEKKSHKGPLFEYVITIQNHSPFNEDKYGYVEDTIVDHDLDKETKEILEAYFMGIRDMDKQIKSLTDYFDSLDEPLVFIYYGDHMPFLNKNYQALKDIGLDINTNRYDKITDIYKTPFFIWVNDAYKDEIKVKPEMMTISANFLAPLVLRTADLVNTDPVYQYLDKLMYKMPVIFKYFYVTRYNGDTDLKTEKEFSVKDKINLMKFESLNYYMTKDLKD